MRRKIILHPPDAKSAMEIGQGDVIGKADAAHERSYATIEFSPEDAPGIRALYDGEVRVFDDLVGAYMPCELPSGSWTTRPSSV